MTGVYVCSDEVLPILGVEVVELERPGGRGPRRQAMVTRLPNGELRAYLNLCKHIPVPLDSYRGEVIEPGGERVLCRTHGAAYRREDGLCVEGPCEGESLDPVRVELRDGEIFIHDPLTTGS